MKKVILWSIGVIFFLFSIGLAGYPFISNYLNSLNAKSELVQYLDTVANSSDKYAEMKKSANDYNKSLVESGVMISDPFSEKDVNNFDYESLLNFEGTSVMAGLEIPSLNINLPIYHGTSDSVLEKGIGHLSSSSLPVGGVGTHAVLTGHTGLSSQKLLTDLDKLNENDVFFINVFGDKLAYKVDNIAVVTPEDTELLQIDSTKDYVTLVTCTPYGVNTHRLLVRGVRISYEEAEEIVSLNPTADNESTWIEEYTSAIILGISVMVGILLVYGFIRLIIYLIRKRKKNEKKDT